MIAIVFGGGMMLAFQINSVGSDRPDDDYAADLAGEFVLESF